MVLGNDASKKIGWIERLNSIRAYKKVREACINRNMYMYNTKFLE